MILPVAQVLPAELITKCLKLGKQDSLFIDGRTTAGWHAREGKHNLQAKQNKGIQSVLAEVEKALLGHELINAAGRPKKIVRLLLSRYDSGMHYDTHVDDAIMSGQRSDLSFTLFLSEKDSYEGGDLVIDEPAAERNFRLDSGSLLLYPSNTLHRVEPVTQGQRIVIVGWIRSLVRSPEQREILFDLERSIAQLRQVAEQADTLTLLLKSRSNLLRMWAED